ncbi:MAG: NUDIX domain-containing protein [Candidatus Woykebacteria bacterium]
MKLLLTIKEQDIFASSPNTDSKDFRSRRAARVVVLDSQGHAALLKVNRYKYHKLPGGGVERGEDFERALKRELLEEIGCEVEILDEVGQIVEYRGRPKLRQTSYCFLARQIGKQHPSSFTEVELGGGFEVEWVEGIVGAIKILAQDQPQNYEGKFIQRRDIEFLRAAKKLSY